MMINWGGRGVARVERLMQRTDWLPQRVSRPRREVDAGMFRDSVGRAEPFGSAVVPTFEEGERKNRGGRCADRKREGGSQCVVDHPQGGSMRSGPASKLAEEAENVPEGFWPNEQNAALSAHSSPMI